MTLEKSEVKALRKWGDDLNQFIINVALALQEQITVNALLLQRHAVGEELDQIPLEDVRQEAKKISERAWTKTKQSVRPENLREIFQQAVNKTKTDSADGDESQESRQESSGSRTLCAGPIAISAMAPEAKDLMERIREAYSAYYDPERDCISPSDIYRFIYWLCRYSGLVRAADSDSSGAADGPHNAAPGELPQPGDWVHIIVNETDHGWHRVEEFNGYQVICPTARSQNRAEGEFDLSWIAERLAKDQVPRIIRAERGNHSSEAWLVLAFDRSDLSTIRTCIWSSPPWEQSILDANEVWVAVYCTTGSSFAQAREDLLNLLALHKVSGRKSDFLAEYADVLEDDISKHVAGYEEQKRTRTGMFYYWTEDDVK